VTNNSLHQLSLEKGALMALKGEVTIDVSASYIRHVIFQANFGYADLQCIKYFLLTNKFMSVFSLQKSSFERAEQLSPSFS